jgi:hypothetical protein
VIRHIHSTRHGFRSQFGPREVLARGVVSEIWFDKAGEPAG